MKRYTKFSLLALAIATFSVTTYAANGKMENDAMSLSKAKISLTQAITAAENNLRGKAAKAEFEHSRKSGWVYDVEIIKGAQVFDVKVDSQKGTVISSVVDKADRDDEHDED